MQNEVINCIDEKTYQKFSWHMKFVDFESDRKMRSKIGSIGILSILKYADENLANIWEIMVKNRYKCDTITNDNSELSVGFCDEITRNYP